MLLNEPQRANLGESAVRSEECTIGNSNKEKLLGAVFDKDLQLDYHVKKICNEAGKKISNPARIAPYLDEEKRNC